MFDLDQIESWSAEDEEVLEPVHNLRTEILSELDEEEAWIVDEQYDSNDDDDLDLVPEWGQDVSIERRIQVASEISFRGKRKNKTN
jgi:hypothetical protein